MSAHFLAGISARALRAQIKQQQSCNSDRLETSSRLYPISVAYTWAWRRRASCIRERYTAHKYRWYVMQCARVCGFSFDRSGLSR